MALFEFGEELIEDVVPIFFDKVNGVVGNADLFAHFDDVFVFFSGLADAMFVFFFPIFHEHADHIIALLLEQQC